MEYSFERLEAWNKSRLLLKEIYKVTRDFPEDEKFGLSSQLRRASVSISSNIAEGSTRWSNKEKARFYEIAYGSLIEVLNQLILSTDLGYVSEEEVADKLRPQIDEVGRMLHALRKRAKE